MSPTSRGAGLPPWGGGEPTEAFSTLRGGSRSSQTGSSSLTAAGVRCLSRRCKENRVPGTCKVTFLFFTGLCRNLLFLPKNLGSLSKGITLLSNNPNCSPVPGPCYSRWSPKTCQQNSLCPGENKLFHVLSYLVMC